MDSGLYIALLNPSIGFILASAFFVFWLQQRQRRHLAVLAAAYTASAVGFLLQQFTPPEAFAVTKLTSNALFVAAALCLATAIFMRYGRRPPVSAFAALGTGGLGAWSWFMFVDPDLTWRIYVVSFALGGISLLVAAELRALPRKTTVEQVLLALSLLSGLNFFVRALVLANVHGPDDVSLHTSVYWTTAILTHAVLSIAIALTLIAGSVLDMIAELRSESQTDPLSGLLNRRGFEEQASRMLADTSNGSLPASLVICDLDHFKAINDTLGHAAGDRVIAAVGKFFASAATARQAAGRIGGEEFAIILPGANLPAARLFAEGTRNAFAALAVEGLPQDHRLTASFGVAELAGGETLIELLARADAALYVAKNEGRDCVRVARPSTLRPALRSAG